MSIKDKMIFDLFKALDDIDTTSDIYKSSYQARCNHVDEIIKSIDIDRDYIEELYNEFYKREDDILTPIFKKEGNNEKL